jgi:hypothetical protein
MPIERGMTGKEKHEQRSNLTPDQIAIFENGAR